MSLLDYRAWHKKRKKMYEVLHLHMETEPWVTAKGFDIINQKDIHVDIQPNDCVIMQYTGCRDKNSNKIFEDDIVRDKKGNIEQVVYFDTAFRVKSQHGIYYKYNLYECEIIGNIHANPELLEV